MKGRGPRNTRDGKADGSADFGHFEREMDESLDPECVALLSHISVTANPAMVMRTQRLVRERAIAMQERRRRQRRACGLAVLAFALVALLLSPAVWASFEQMQYVPSFGESFVEAAPQSIYLLLWAIPAAAALGILGWRRSNMAEYGPNI